MKEFDNVELIRDRECYAKEGIYKGMQGLICYEKKIPDYSLVEFPLYGEAGDIGIIDVRDEDLKLIDAWSALVNERIKAEHEKEGKSGQHS